jgi:hypothetical protein
MVFSLGRRRRVHRPTSWHWGFIQDLTTFWGRNCAAPPIIRKKSGQEGVKESER